MATLHDAIELLRDPGNLIYLGDRSAGLAVRVDRVIRLLHARGAESEQEARTLIRQAARALGGDEVIVRRPGVLRADRFGSEPRRPETAYWVPPVRRRAG